jgi:hypothetical protein
MYSEVGNWGLDCVKIVDLDKNGSFQIFMVAQLF